MLVRKWDDEAQAVLQGQKTRGGGIPDGVETVDNGNVEQQAFQPGECTVNLAEGKPEQCIIRKFLLDSIGQNTFEVSYTGRVPFCGLERYISDFTPILDMRLSGGISIEIFSLGEDFCVNMMQRNSDGRYRDCFAGILAEYGIRCAMDAPEHFEINDFVLPASAQT